MLYFLPWGYVVLQSEIMSRAGVLQTDLGPELLEEIKREAKGLGLTASGYVRLLVKQRPALSEKGGSKKAKPKREKRLSSSR